LQKLSLKILDISANGV